MRDLANDLDVVQGRHAASDGNPDAQRSILMLQGPPSPFWHELARGFTESGHRVHKVHLCLADELFWRGRDARPYRGSLAAWSDFLSRLIAEQGITDVLYYADRLPYHRLAADVASGQGVRAWVIENGYLRPDWLTLEPVGMSRFSRFPRVTEALRQAAKDLPKPDLVPRFSHGFWEEAVREVLFGLTIPAGRFFYPQYRADRYYPPLLDYLSWGLRLAQQMRNGAAGREAIRMCEGAALSFNLLAMQLQSDYQIRQSSDYSHLSDMLNEVIASFARHAPVGRHLVIKGHPLDNGWENWPGVVRRLARNYGVVARVHWVDGGDLGAMIKNNAGLITVNSTVGLLGLRLGSPVIALGDAIYDVDGMTHRAGIDSFWSSPSLPDSQVTTGFVRALIAKVQVRGSFHDQSGRESGIREIVQRIERAEYF